MKKTIPLIFTIFCFICCAEKTKLKAVTVTDFAKFVVATGYITDAEKYGWSIVQKTVYDYTTVQGANWKKPNGTNSTAQNMPVTQVSYNDAVAYCKWANVRLPSYEEYWHHVKNDERKIVCNALKVCAAKEANIVGNTWDITRSENPKGDIRLAGGSYLCSKFTCDGTDPNRKLYVSKDTGNVNISFCVLEKE